MYTQSVPALVSKNIGNTLANYKTWNSILVNVKEYGAKGDGVTDDTAAINAALSAASAYLDVTVYGSGRTYYISSTLVIPQGVKLENFRFKPAPSLSVLIQIGDGITRHDRVCLNKIEIDATSAKTDFIGIYGRYSAYNDFNEIMFKGIKASTQKAYNFEGLEHFTGSSMNVYGAGTGFRLYTGPSGANDITFNGSYIADCGVSGLDIGDQIDSAVFIMPYFELCQDAIQIYTGSVTVVNPIFDAITGYWVNYTYSGGASLTMILPKNTLVELMAKINDATRSTSSSFITKSGIGVRKISKPANGIYDYLTIGSNPDFSDSRIMIYPNDFGGVADNFTTANGITLVYRDTSFGSIRIVTQNGTERLRFYGDGRIRLGGSAGPFIMQGTGTPNGNWSAPVGSIFLRTDGGTATSMYVKESGTGNTGWVAK